jgi:hypothetical protein
MSEEIKVKPTPIQRNEFDVAMELTEYYLKYNRQDKTVDLIQDTFVKFYAMAKGVEMLGPSDLAKLVDNPEIAEIFAEYQ